MTGVWRNKTTWGVDRWALLTVIRRIASHHLILPMDFSCAGFLSSYCAHLNSQLRRSQLGADLLHVPSSLYPPSPPPPHTLIPPPLTQASEEQILSVYPTAIRRRILRYLYLNHLQVRVSHLCGVAWYYTSICKATPGESALPTQLTAPHQLHL